MKKKILGVLLGSVLVSSTLSGCIIGSGGNEITELNGMQALNTESETNNYSMTLSEKESMVYSQVSERQLLDLSLLEDCSETELQQVNTYMDAVDSQLSGEIEAKEGVIDQCFTNYLLAEFEKTPYFWQRTMTEIRGIDSGSRSIIADVTYSTIGFEKEFQEDSYIVAGEEDYDTKMRIRYTRWLGILGDKYGGARGNWRGDLNKFKKIYGDPEKIIESQRNLSLTDLMFEGGNQKTYSGLVDSNIEKQSATMTVRYVLVPKYAMGVNLGIECKHMYVVNYALSSDPTEGLELFKEDGYTTVSDNVFKLVDSYFKCIDESDVYGMNKLTYRFDKCDKYYLDMFDTSYSKHNNYSVSLFDIKGTKITCGVQIASKVRARGSNMTMPVYTDRYYMELQLIDDTLQVTNMILISRKLEGEPAINTNDADDVGFVRSIDLNFESKQQIEKLICDFSGLQLLKDDKSDDFMAVVDYSMSDNKLNYLRESMKVVGGKKKVVWLENYQNGTSNYASVKCKEQYQQTDKSIIETEATYEFISKGSKWYVYGYDVLSSVKLDTTNLTTANSLCIVTAGKTEEYNSQVDPSEDKKKQGDETNRDGVVYTHALKIPVLKNGQKSQGLLRMTLAMLSDGQCDAMLKERGNELGVNVTIEKTKQYDSDRKLNSNKKGSLTYIVRLMLCYAYNVDNNRLGTGDKQKDLQDLKTVYADSEGNWGTDDVVKNIQSIYSNVITS